MGKRSCTDPLCFLLLLVFLGGWVVIAYFGVTEGDLEKVIYPTDTDGNVCGKGPLKDRKLLMMFDLTQCLNPAILVTGCPTPQVSGVSEKMFPSYKRTFLCSLPKINTIHRISPSD